MFSSDLDSQPNGGIAENCLTTFIPDGDNSPKWFDRPCVEESDSFGDPGHKFMCECYFPDQKQDPLGDTFAQPEYNFNEELLPKPQPLQIEDGHDEDDDYGFTGRIDNRRNRRLERRNRRLDKGRINNKRKKRLDRRNRRLDRRNRRLGRTKRDLGEKSYHRQLLCNLICKKRQ